MKQENNRRELTPKQERFCNAFIETGNASEAYRLAYNAIKMKSETINVKACHMLKKDKIKTRVSELQKELKAKSDITKEDAVNVLVGMINTEVLDVLNIKGDIILIKSLDDIPDVAKKAIKSIKNTKFGIEIAFHDKLTALQQLSRMLGWDAPIKQEVEINRIPKGVEVHFISMDKK